MNREFCTIVSCNHPVVARGWCRKHYTRWQRKGTPDDSPKTPVAECAVGNCPSPAKARGFCQLHYGRVLKHGDPLAKLNLRGEMTENCTVPGCHRPPQARNLCTNHYALQRRNGKPETVRKFRGTYIKDGYRYVMVGYRHYEPEHRLLMEKRIGRKLATEEHVHHKNGDTLDNRIGNLEVLTRAEHMNEHRDLLTRSRWDNYIRKPPPPKKPLAAHCKHGHEYTPENTRTTKGWRECRTCDRIAAKVRRDKGSSVV